MSYRARRKYGRRGASTRSTESPSSLPIGLQVRVVLHGGLLCTSRGLDSGCSLPASSQGSRHYRDYRFPGGIEQRTVAVAPGSLVPVPTFGMDVPLRAIF